MRRFNPTLFNYLNEHGEEHIIKEWVDIVNKKFNENFTLKQMQVYFSRYGIPHKYEHKNKSHSNLALPIGSERTKSDGMVQVKVGPHKWAYKQRKIYEEYYGVKLKEDEYVIFLDQNRNNFDIDNLKLVTRRESAVMANNNLFSKNKKVTETGNLVAKLIIKTKEIGNENE